MALDRLTLFARQSLQEVTTFCGYLSATYGTGDLSRDGVSALAAVVLVYTVMSLIKNHGKASTVNTDFEDAVSIISDALELTSIQISEMRYRLLTEFDRTKRELELARHARQTQQLLPAPRKFDGLVPSGGGRRVVNS